MLGTFVGGHNELVIGGFLNRFGTFTEGEARLEWSCLLHQVVNEVARQDFGVGRNIINGFLWVNLSALAARLRQCVDQMATELQESGFEYCEQSDRTRTDDDDIGFNHARKFAQKYLKTCESFYDLRQSNKQRAVNVPTK